MDEYSNTRIVSRGPFTIATPISYSNAFRKTSDLIGNNYSPNAKNLNIKKLNVLSPSN